MERSQIIVNMIKQFRGEENPAWKQFDYYRAKSLMPYGHVEGRPVFEKYDTLQNLVAKNIDKQSTEHYKSFSQILDTPGNSNVPLEKLLSEKFPTIEGQMRSVPKSTQATVHDIRKMLVSTSNTSQYPEDTRLRELYHPFVDDEKIDVMYNNKVESADVFKLYKQLYPDSTAQRLDHRPHRYDIVADPVKGETFVIPTPTQTTGEGYAEALDEFYN